MRLDKRGVETLSLCAFLGLLAVGTSVYKTTSPVIQSDLSTPVIESEAYVGSEMAELNVGTTITFNTAEEEIIAEADATVEPESNEPVASAPASTWDNKFMVKESGTVNIRAAADIESAIVGKIEQDASGDVVEKGETWTKISSGSVEGYIATEFLVFGAEAEAQAQGKGSFITTILENCVRVRKGASADTQIIGLVGEDHTFTAIDGKVENGFVAINYLDETGYVSAEFVKTEYQLETAKTLREIQVEEARKRAATMAEGVRVGAAYAASADDVSLLASLIYCEAGNQSHAGKLAVGAVVMNRVRSPIYPNNIFDVIYQKGQFPPASVFGRVGNVLMNQSYNSDCVAAAEEALAGMSNVGGAIGFDFASSGRAGIVIGPVVFF